MLLKAAEYPPGIPYLPGVSGVLLGAVKSMTTPYKSKTPKQMHFGAGRLPEKNPENAMVFGASHTETWFSFFYPDYTVDPGISPSLTRMALVGCHHRSGIGSAAPSPCPEGIFCCGVSIWRVRKKVNQATRNWGKVNSSSRRSRIRGRDVNIWAVVQLISATFVGAQLARIPAIWDSPIVEKSSLCFEAIPPCLLCRLPPFDKGGRKASDREKATCQAGNWEKPQNHSNPSNLIT